MGEQQDIGRLEGRLIGVEGDIRRIMSSIYGNGREGLIEKNTRIEEGVEAIAKKLDDMDSKMDGIAKNSERIEDLEKELGKEPSTALELLKDKNVVKLLIMVILTILIIIKAIDIGSLAKLLASIG